MSPDDKACLVQYAQKASPDLVGMCGDGSNDCNALKAADVGLSLSEAEASIAAPFTSKIQNISALERLLREGRCALSTSFQMFKFLAMYAFIQLIGSILCKVVVSDLGDFQYLYTDIIVIIPLFTLLGMTGPYHKLTKKLPPKSLIGPEILLSVIGHFIISIFFQTII